MRERRRLDPILPGLPPSNKLVDTTLNPNDKIVPLDGRGRRDNAVRGGELGRLATGRGDSDLDREGDDRSGGHDFLADDWMESRGVSGGGEVGRNGTERTLELGADDLDDGPVLRNLEGSLLLLVLHPRQELLHLPSSQPPKVRDGQNPLLSRGG